MSGSDPERGFSWYDVLGVLPGASAQKIQRTYEAKMSLLRPELISGAPSSVVRAASRAQGILDAARRALGDPQTRERYDQLAGFRRSGEGLARPVDFPSDPGWGPADFSYAGGRDAPDPAADRPGLASPRAARGPGPLGQLLPDRVRPFTCWR